jgi:hypothetical protein
MLMNTLQAIALIYVVGWLAFLPHAYEGDRHLGSPRRSRAQAVLDAVWIAAFWPISRILDAITFVAGRLQA